MTVEGEDGGTQLLTLKEDRAHEPKEESRSSQDAKKQEDGVSVPAAES